VAKFSLLQSSKVHGEPLKMNCPSIFYKRKSFSAEFVGETTTSGGGNY